MLKGRNLVSSSDFTVEEIEEIIELGDEIYKSPQDFSDLCKGKILGTLFFEPSTRTRLSFESAIHRLGGDCIGFSDTSSSSVTKGESLKDTIKTVSNYVDLIAMRHPKEGSAALASSVTGVPLINGGDGGHEHPTQTMTDLFTIHREKGQLSGMKIGFCGDLKFGRTVHSLIKAMASYEGNEFYFISPEELVVPEFVKLYLDERSIKYQEVDSLEKVLGDVDVLYMTRVQKERFFNEADYIRLKDYYELNEENIKLAKEDMIVLHPLPRNNEISESVDSDPRAKYFEQVKCGVIIRMALILKLLGVR